MKLKNLKKSRDACLNNAEALLNVAEREINNGVEHICFHLALLALEEIGKAGILLVVYTQNVSSVNEDNNGPTNWIDDHIKKMFWALWSGIFGPKKFIAKEVEESRDMASFLHEKRLESLYTNPEMPVEPANRVSKEEAVSIIKLTRARLAEEKSVELEDTTEYEDAESAKWFLNATEDPEKRKFIFSNTSLQKLEELRSGKKWAGWLKDEFKKNEEEMRTLTEKEIKREAASDVEGKKPKYKMKIKVQSSSHTIRNNAFQEWNDEVPNIKLYKSEKKQIIQGPRSEFFVEFTFPMTVTPNVLWDLGFSMAKTFNTALNISTRGLFWWNVQKDIEKYYEEIVDIEADKSGHVKLAIVPQPPLNVGWEKAGLVLKKDNLINIHTVYAFLLRENKKLKDFLINYALGITMISKSDIHLRLELNAYEKLFDSLKNVLIVLGDWDGKSDIKKVIRKQIGEYINPSDLDRTIELGEKIKSEKGNSIPQIMPSDVMVMKVCIDLYMQIKAAEYFKAMKKK